MSPSLEFIAKSESDIPSGAHEISIVCQILVLYVVFCGVFVVQSFCQEIFIYSSTSSFACPLGIFIFFFFGLLRCGYRSVILRFYKSFFNRDSHMILFKCTISLDKQPSEYINLVNFVLGLSHNRHIISLINTFFMHPLGQYFC